MSDQQSADGKRQIRTASGSDRLEHSLAPLRPPAIPPGEENEGRAESQAEEIEVQYPVHSSDSITRQDIVREARSLLGVPFRHQGKSADTGVDCRGLLLVVGERLGRQLIGEYRDNYARDPDPVEFRQALETEFELLPSIVDAKPGDVFLIRFPRQTPEQATHAGILAEGPFEPMLIHASGTDYEGWVQEEPLRRWEPFLVDAFRFRNLAKFLTSDL